MKKILCCMKSKDSYLRIIKQINNDRKADFELEEFITDIEEVQEKFVFTEYDFAIVDEKLWWKDDVIDLFNRKNVKYVLFQGDFEEVINYLYSLFPIDTNPQPPADTTTDDNVLNSSTDNVEAVQQVKYIELEKKIYVNNEVKVPVYKSVYTGLPNKLIAVLSLCSKCGSTTLTLNIAKYLSTLDILASVIEPPIYDKSFIYDALDIKNRYIKNAFDTNSEFYSFAHELNEGNKIEKNREFIDEGILWIVPDSNKPKINNWDYFKMMKLLYSSKKSSISLLDVGTYFEHESVKDVLKEADLILVVIDPLLINLSQNSDKLNELLDMKYKLNMPIEFVINKWNPGVDKNKLISFTKIQPFIYVPFINPELIYKASFNNDILYNLDEIREIIDKPIYQICKLFIPHEFLKDNVITNDDKTYKNYFFKQLLALLTESFTDIFKFILKFLKYFLSKPFLLFLIITAALLFINKINPIYILKNFIK